jgi:hypothetical protein
VATSIHLAELALRHRMLGDELAEALQHPSVDDFTLAELKRRKLQLKDEITRLAHMEPDGMPLFPAINAVEASPPAAAMSEVCARAISGSTTKQFHDQAEECRSLAAKAPKAVDKAFWLRLSDYWVELGDEAKRGALDKAPS